MNYQPEDFKRCVFNPLERDQFERNPTLIEVFGDVLLLIAPKLVAYAIACYDPNSPLVADYPEWLRRKQEAAIVAGFDLEKDEKVLEGVFSGEDEQALEIIHTFLRRCIRSREWAMIVANEEVFWEYNQRLKIPIAKTDRGDKDMVSAVAMKTKLSEDQYILHERINRLKKEFFGGDEDLMNASELNINFSAEGIAKQLRK